jgi:adenosylcobinamide-GDP ribazoletransferase
MRRALGFLTVLGGASTPTGTTLTWFPLAGALVGLVLGTIWWLAARAWPAGVAATIVVVADLAITGLLHVDGLADSADGLIAPMSRERRLAVMADPATGAFGVAAEAAVLLMRVVSLSALAASPLLLAAIWCASRTGMAVVARTLPYARDEGLASDFLGGPALPVALIGTALSVLLAFVGGGRLPHRWVGLVGVVAVATGVALVAGLAKRRLGGFTGDVLGAAGVVGETLGLLAMAARWR